MFHKASVRLAGLYLAVMMLISLFFSVVVYQTSVHEFDRGLRHPNFVEQGLPGTAANRPFFETIVASREDQYTEAKQRVLNQLIIINIVILLGGGLLCYFLALMTLKPVEEAHEALERFTADASHELRTPIAAMQSEIEVALMNPKLTLADSKAILGSNLEELTKLTNLAEGLLKLAQLGNGQLEHDKVVIAQLVENAIDRVTTQASKKKIALHTTVKSDVTIPGNETSLTEAVVAILENAVKYSPEKSTVEVRVSDQAKQVVIEIEDHGMGMKPAELDHIFERFYRADTARSKAQTNGYGIGLAIAKNIVDLHGGNITVSSKPGKGSTFVISLPKVIS